MIPKAILSLNEEYQLYLQGSPKGLNEFQTQFLEMWAMKPKTHEGQAAPTNKKSPPLMRAFQIWFLKTHGPNTYSTISGADSLRFSEVDTVRDNIRADRLKGLLMPKFTPGFNREHIRVCAPRRYCDNWVSSNGDGTRGKRAWQRLGVELHGGEYHPDVDRQVPFFCCFVHCPM